jgi:hypothetical protein
MTENHSASDEFEPGQAERLDLLCDEFEAACLQGQAPRLEDYLSRADESDREALVRELLRLEVEYRVQRGERLSLEEYQNRLPKYTNLAEDILAQLLKAPLQSDVESDSHMASTQSEPNTPRSVVVPSAIDRYGIATVRD